MEGSYQESLWNRPNLFSSCQQFSGIIDKHQKIVLKLSGLLVNVKIVRNSKELCKHFCEMSGNCQELSGTSWAMDGELSSKLSGNCEEIDGNCQEHCLKVSGFVRKIVCQRWSKIVRNFVRFGIGRWQNSY